MLELLFLFMMFSVVGWLWESPWVSFNEKKWVNRGFLYGPYIPIYGCAIVTIVYSMGVFNSMDPNKWYIIIMQMIYMGLVTAVWEYLTSWALEKIFHTRWWDYSRHKYNLNGRISLHVTIFFGLGGFFLYRVVLPPFLSIYETIPESTWLILLSVFYVVFSIDSYFTLRHLFKVRNIMVTIERLSEELRTKLEVKVLEMKGNVIERKDSLQQSLVEIKDELSLRYSETYNKNVPPRLKQELEKVSNVIGNNMNVMRFYRKYPNSSSFQTRRVRKVLNELSSRVKQVRR